MLIQSRSSSLRDVLTSRDINEIADSPAGAVTSALSKPREKANELSNGVLPPTDVSYATVNHGTVKFEEKQQ